MNRFQNVLAKANSLKQTARNGVKRAWPATALAALGLLSVLVSLPARPVAQTQDYQGYPAREFAPPSVFQAAGPTVASIQSTVDAYRAALGENNGNKAGPLDSGRREINWDGGSPTNQNTTITGNPFVGFQVTRGALFTTPDGVGFIQAPATADPALFPPGGMAGQFNNPTYGNIFTAFSPARLFSAIGGRLTDVTFFVPGNSNMVAAVTGFGAVFTDVDQQDGSGAGRKHANRKASTLIEYYGSYGELLFSNSVPAAPGNGGLSFFGIVLRDTRIARVRITSGDAAPGPNDDGRPDIVMMDDFIYSEPKPLY